MSDYMDLFSGKTLLITGGTGSFGNAVLERFLKTNIKQIRIFSRDELKQDQMRRKYRNEKIKYYIGDVKDINSVRNSIRGGGRLCFSCSRVKTGSFG